MNETQTARLPRFFCWTRFGTEAGEPIGHILKRKERERRRTSGLFYWGIGNSIAPALSELIRRCDRPEVLFSPIRSRPRPGDVRPPSLLVWRLGETLLGDRLDLPASVLVTSRGDPSTKSAHYALVCAAERPLILGEFGEISLGALRNLLSGKPVGASQVTAVVEHVGEATADTPYPVALRASLVPPYFIRLHKPTAILGNQPQKSATSNASRPAPGSEALNPARMHAH
jgi:hypothetical protein